MKAKQRVPALRSGQSDDLVAGSSAASRISLQRAHWDGNSPPYGREPGECRFNEIPTLNSYSPRLLSRGNFVNSGDDMTDTVVIPSGDVNRLVYVAIAGARDDAETDLLAGLTSHLLRRQPTATVTTLRNAINEVQAAIAAHRPARESDLAANSALLMSRLLTRVVPALTTSEVKGAARDYTRAFFRSHRAGTPLRRQVAPLELQFDRF